MPELAADLRILIKRELRSGFRSSTDEIKGSELMKLRSISLFALALLVHSPVAASSLRVEVSNALYDRPSTLSHLVWGSDNKLWDITTEENRHVLSSNDMVYGYDAESSWVGSLYLFRDLVF